MIEDIDVVVAKEDELPAAQRFYEARGYGGATIARSDFVVLAKHHGDIVGVGRLCQEQELLWLRGMQIEPKLQRQGVGTEILQRLHQEIGTRWCCCLPYSHLVGFSSGGLRADRGGLAVRAWHAASQLPRSRAQCGGNGPRITATT